MGRKTAARHIGYDRPMDYDALMVRLEGLGSAANRTGKARYGINTARAFGISVPELKAVAKDVGRDHALAGRLRQAVLAHAPCPRQGGRMDGGRAGVRAPRRASVDHVAGGP